jgi:hypothetical protein
MLKMLTNLTGTFLKEERRWPNGSDRFFGDHLVQFLNA